MLLPALITKSTSSSSSSSTLKFFGQEVERHPKNSIIQNGIRSSKIRVLLMSYNYVGYDGAGQQ
jgi:hypothetical protein